MNFADQLRAWAEARQAEWDSHVRPEVRALGARGNVTLDEWEVLGAQGMNSFERETLYPALADEALAKVVEYCLSQCGQTRRPYRPASTYDDAMITVFAPLLLERLRGRREP